MIILGLNHGENNSSAALIKDGKIFAGAPEERFNRQKFTKVFPKGAIDFCLNNAGIKLKDCDFIAQAWNPGANWVTFNPILSSHRIRREDNFYTIPDHLYRYMDRQPGEWTLTEFPVVNGQKMPAIYHVKHHCAHAANAFFMSDFEEAAILTADWRGEIECTTKSIGKGNKIETFRTQNVPNSLGMFYATYTQLLGYQPDNDEWKVMALSAHQVDCSKIYEKIKTTFTLTGDGDLELDTSYYAGALVEHPRLYTKRLVDILGGREGVAGVEPDEWYITVAKAMQMAAEDIATHLLNDLHKRTGCNDLVLGGGFFMNSVYNGKVLRKTPFKRVYISFAPSDAGNSIGAALYVAHCIKNQKREHGFRTSLIGPEYPHQEMEASLTRRKIKFEKPANIAQTVVTLLSKSEAVAVFNGRMEFGDRALGSRSILGDPRNPLMKDKINSIIKYREAYRPFAPSTLSEKVSKYFDVPADFQCPYMEKVVQVRREFQKDLPAVTHFDGSGRVQTVDREVNPYFHAVISEFEKLTGLPIVLNTSFNVNGEPIVMTPDDAISTFFNSGLEYMALGPYLVKK